MTEEQEVTLGAFHLRQQAVDWRPHTTLYVSYLRSFGHEIGWETGQKGLYDDEQMNGTVPKPSSA